MKTVALADGVQQVSELRRRYKILPAEAVLPAGQQIGWQRGVIAGHADYSAPAD